MMKIWCLLLCVATPLAAQSMRSRLEGRIPAAAVPPVDSLVQQAASEGLPTEPLIQKAIEGGAKGVSAQRIAAAVQVALGQLRDARALLVRAGDEPPITAAEVTTVSSALKRGLLVSVVERVVAGLPNAPRGSALQAVADLVAHRFDPDSSVDLVIVAAHMGLHGARLLDVATATVHELQRGRTRAEALARVRQELPDVPTTPSPGRAAAVRARRPAAQPWPAPQP